MDRFEQLKKWVVLGLSLVALALAVPALAQSHGGGGGGRGGGHAGGHGGGYGGGRGGGWHGGGLGWWGLGLGLGLGWGAATLAYPYVYPAYPAYGYPPDYENPYAGAPALAAPGAPPVGAAPGAQAPAATWYYCEPSAAYYPYVGQCAQPWRVVPATPGGPPH